MWAPISDSSSAHLVLPRSCIGGCSHQCITWTRHCGILWHPLSAGWWDWAVNRNWTNTTTRRSAKDNILWDLANQCHPVGWSTDVLCRYFFSVITHDRHRCSWKKQYFSKSFWVINWWLPIIIVIIVIIVIIIVIIVDYPLLIDD